MSMSISFSRKVWFILISFLMGAALLFAPLMKAEASVSWGQEVTEVAKRYVGYKFKWAGDSPKTGFDASGYTQYVYKTSAAKINLPHSSKAQYKLGKSVKKSELQQGDLVFFNTNGKEVSFVGIYDKDGYFFAATSDGVKRVSLNSKYWKDRYVGAKRILK